MTVHFLTIVSLLLLIPNHYHCFIPSSSLSLPQGLSISSNVIRAFNDDRDVEGEVGIVDSTTNVAKTKRQNCFATTASNCLAFLLVGIGIGAPLDALAFVVSKEDPSALTTPTTVNIAASDGQTNNLDFGKFKDLTKLPSPISNLNFDFSKSTNQKSVPEVKEPSNQPETTVDTAVSSPPDLDQFKLLENSLPESDFNKSSKESPAEVAPELNLSEPDAEAIVTTTPALPPPSIEPSDQFKFPGFSDLQLPSFTSEITPVTPNVRRSTVPPDRKDVPSLFKAPSFDQMTLPKVDVPDNKLQFPEKIPSLNLPESEQKLPGNLPKLNIPENIIPKISLPTPNIPNPEEAQQNFEKLTKEKEEREKERKERYEQYRREVEEEKQARIREYDEKFIKDQEESDRYYGQKALENRKGVEQLKKEQRDSVQRGLFQDMLPLQMPEERAPIPEEPPIASKDDANDKISAEGRVQEQEKVQQSAPQVRSLTATPSDDLNIEDKTSAGADLSQRQEKESRTSTLSPVERRQEVAASRQGYSDKVALRKARVEVERIQKKIEFEEQLKEIRAKRKEEETLVQNRAEINAMKLQQIKQKNAEARIKRAEELQAKQRKKFEEANEARGQIEFERELNNLDTFFNRKEKMENGKIERAAKGNQ